MDTEKKENSKEGVAEEGDSRAEAHGAQAKARGLAGARRAQGLIAAAVLGAAIAALYWPAVVRGEFLADDWWFVSHYTLARWLATFKGDWILGQWGTGAYYRPLVAGSMMLDDKLFGIWRPGGWHAVNLVIHWANAWLLFAIGRKVLGSDVNFNFRTSESRNYTSDPGFVAALAGAAFFALYPRFPEAVYWISGRTVLLVMTFVLVTLLLFLKEEEFKVAQASTPASDATQVSLAASPRKQLWRWSYLTTALACLTTETALTIPLILTAAAIFYDPRPGPESKRRVDLAADLKADARALRSNLIPAARRLAPYFAIILVYFAWRWAALGGPGGYPEQKAGLVSLHALAIPLSHYVYALLNPARYHVPPELFWPMAVWTLALGAAVIVARRRMPRGLGLGVWWMIVALGPYVNLALVDEERGRFLYPAAAGFFLAAAAAGAAAWRWIALHSRPAAGALAAIVVLAMGGLYAAHLRGQVANWDEASATSRRIIGAVLEKYPAPPEGKPMIFAHVDMDPNRKTSLHAIRGALLYPTPMLPTPFGKIYGAKGTPLEAWGWGMIPEGAPPEGSPFVLIDAENQVTIYETGESSVREFSAEMIWKTWSAKGNITFHEESKNRPCISIASNPPQKIAATSPPNVTVSYPSSLQYMLFDESTVWLTFDLSLEILGDGRRIRIQGRNFSRPDREAEPLSLPLPPGAAFVSAKQYMLVDCFPESTGKPSRTRIPYSQFEGNSLIEMIFFPSADGEVRLYNLEILASPLHLKTDDHENQRH